MSQLLSRFSFSTAKWNSQVAICLLLVWMAIVFCAISSIRSQGYSDLQRRFWIAVIVFVPIFGLLAYLPFSFKHEDLPTHLTLRTRERKRGSRAASNSSSGKS